jgi:hypothetical protein
MIKLTNEGKEFRLTLICFNNQVYSPLGVPWDMFAVNIEFLLL